jgi:hypothetical protein
MITKSPMFAENKGTCADGGLENKSASADLLNPKPAKRSSQVQRKSRRVFKEPFRKIVAVHLARYQAVVHPLRTVGACSTADRRAKVSKIDR